MSVLFACGSTKHRRIDERLCETCGFVTVHLLSMADCGYWGTGVLCSSCGAETGEAGSTPPADETVDAQLARIDDICAQVDEACDCVMEFFGGDLEGGFMYAPCVHELARWPMDRRMYMWMLQELGGVVKVRAGMDRTERGVLFDAFPDGTILDDQVQGISMAAMKVEGRWETQGNLVSAWVRDAFMDGRIWVRGSRA